MTSVLNITEVPLDLIALIGEFSANVDFFSAVSDEFKEKNLHVGAQKIASVAADMMPNFVIFNLLEEEKTANLITDPKNKSIALKRIEEKYSAQILSNLALQRPEKATEIFTQIIRMIQSMPIAADMMPSFVIFNLLEEEKTVNLITDPKNKSVALKRIAEKYTAQILSNLALQRPEKATEIFTQIIRMIHTMPDKNIMRLAILHVHNKSLRFIDPSYIARLLNNSENMNEFYMKFLFDDAAMSDN